MTQRERDLYYEATTRALTYGRGLLRAANALAAIQFARLAQEREGVSEEAWQHTADAYADAEAAVGELLHLGGPAESEDA